MTDPNAKRIADELYRLRVATERANKERKKARKALQCIAGQLVTLAEVAEGNDMLAKALSERANGPQSGPEPIPDP